MAIGRNGEQFADILNQSAIRRARQLMSAVEITNQIMLGSFSPADLALMLRAVTHRISAKERDYPEFMETARDLLDSCDNLSLAIKRNGRQ